MSPADVVSYEGDNGPFADVTDDSGLPVGTVLWDPTSEIRARLVSTTRTRDPLGLFATRLERAEHRRKSDLKDAGAFRLCHGDADGIPGVFIDRFGDALHVDVDSPVLLPWLEALLAGTMERQGINTVVLRHAGRVERLRGTTSTARYREGQLDLEVDLGRDDVRRLSAELDAMKRLRAWARGRTLDVFANGGGFGLQLAQAGASSSTIVDLGTDHAERVQTFARGNGLADHGLMVFWSRRRRCPKLECTDRRAASDASTPKCARRETSTASARSTPTRDASNDDRHRRRRRQPKRTDRIESDPASHPMTG